MKSNLIARLQRCNNGLKAKSFANYLAFLEVLLRSNPSDLTRDLLSSLSAGNYTELVLKADSYSSAKYGTAREHTLANQFCSVIRKYPFPSGSVSFDPRKKALETFLASEHKCKRINQRFRAYENVRSPHGYSLNSARSWIRSVIGGEIPLNQLGEHCRFGPGASVGVAGNSTSVGAKLLTKKWTVTPGASYLACAMLKDDIHVFELLSVRRGDIFCVDPHAFNRAFGEKVKLVSSNKITFVPKTAMTERTIAVEPLLNGYLQLGVDAIMKKFLKRVGIDLGDQSRNQALAREGSLGGDDPWVTIDLSSASDSVSRGLCRYLLPPDWFAFLDSIRSHNYLLLGVEYSYEKFVTMGNGFCFPLETLLFCSLCHAACLNAGVKPEFQVYGDDILVRQSVAEGVLELLKVCGFRPNSNKTFISGPFRESCGADWFNGDDVRPITLDYPFETIQSVFKFCNLLRSKNVWEDIFFEAKEFLVSLIPPDLMFSRPYKGQVDTALEVPLDVFMSSKFARFNRETQGWSWRELAFIPRIDTSLEGVAGYNCTVMKGAMLGLRSNPIPDSSLDVASYCSNPFTMRRETRTKIRRNAYSGATSNWTPASADWYFQFEIFLPFRWVLSA